MKIRKFIGEQKIYVWMVVFIILFNIAISFSDTRTESEIPSPIGRRGEELESEFISKEDLMKKILEERRPSAILLVLVGLIGVLALFCGLLLDIGFLLLWPASVLWIERRRGKEPIRVGWNIGDLVKVTILFLFFGYSLYILGSVLLSVFQIKIADAHLRILINATTMDILALSIVAYFISVKYKQRLKSIGLSLKGWLHNVLLGITGYIAILPILALSLILVLWAASTLGYQPQPTPILEVFVKESRLKFLIYLILFISVIGPIIEEIFFRGFTYNAIKNTVGPRRAIILSSALFAFLHMNPIGFLPIMALGILLAYLYEKTGSLLPSIAVHILHNSMLLVLFFLMKGLSA